MHCGKWIGAKPGELAGSDMAKGAECGHWLKSGLAAIKRRLTIFDQAP
jgi:hypothetical protein